MKVKLLTSRAGLDFSQNRDEEIEVSAAEGKRLIEAGQAIPVRAAKVQTTSKRSKSEKTSKTD